MHRVGSGNAYPQSIAVQSHVSRYGFSSASRQRDQARSGSRNAYEDLWLTGCQFHDMSSVRGYDQFTRIQGAQAEVNGLVGKADWRRTLRAGVIWDGGRY